MKLVYGGTFGRRGSSGEQPGSIELKVESGGYQVALVNLNLEDLGLDLNALTLKLVKNGDSYTGSFSVDGKDFKEVGKVNVLLKDIRAGLMALDGEFPAQFARFRRFFQSNNDASTPFEVTFDYFNIENKGIK